MAVAVQEASTSVDVVTEAVLDVYRAQLDDATEMALAELTERAGSVGAVRAIVAAESRTVEIVLDDDASPDTLTDVAWFLHERSWQVNVLVHLSRLGDTHTDLRGTPVTLQGWWLDDDAVRFAGFERP
ncbi:MAG: hypothetical protein R2823_09360 [Acidimicrobiia bacterium]